MARDGKQGKPRFTELASSSFRDTVADDLPMDAVEISIDKSREREIVVEF